MQFTTKEKVATATVITSALVIGVIPTAILTAGYVYFEEDIKSFLKAKGITKPKASLFDNIRNLWKN